MKQLIVLLLLAGIAHAQGGTFIPQPSNDPNVTVWIVEDAARTPLMRFELRQTFLAPTPTPIAASENHVRIAATEELITHIASYLRTTCHVWWPPIEGAAVVEVHGDAQAIKCAVWAIDAGRRGCTLDDGKTMCPEERP